MSAAIADARQDAALPPEEAVKRIRQGSGELRNAFIAQYQPFIASVTARLINRPAEGQDEYSVAMDAFNEAIDRYEPSRGKGFLSWCDTVINHRVIDYIRSNRKHARTYPFTWFEAEDSDGVVERAISGNPWMLQENLEIREEIDAFRERLAAFGIKLSDLVLRAPRHIDTKAMCVSLARTIACSAEMTSKLERTGRIPISTLMESVKIGRKAIENNRKYIIALYIILTSRMEIIKGYIDFMEKGVSGK